MQTVNFNTSDESTAIDGTLSSNVLNITNPGWAAILFGVLIVVAGVGYWRLSHRFGLAIAMVVLGFVHHRCLRQLSENGSKDRRTGRSYSPVVDRPTRGR